MFSDITIVRLTESDPLFDFQIPWNAVDTCDQNQRTNIEMLIEAGILVSYASFAGRMMPEVKQDNCAVIPVHYHLNPSGAYVEMLGDISDSHMQDLSELLVDYLGPLVCINNKQIWISESSSLQSSRGEWVAQIAGRQEAAWHQEVEMALYQHKINQDREARQQLSVSGVWVLNGDTPSSGELAKVKHLITNVPWLTLITDSAQKGGSTLTSWLVNPFAPGVVVVGRESGDHEVESIKTCMLGMLSTGKCRRVTLIEPSGKRVYHSNLFSKISYKFGELINRD